MWVAGVRDGKLYTVAERPIDPRWSMRDLHTALGICANAQHLGFDPERAFRAAEGIVMKSIYHGISWPETDFTDDMNTLENLDVSRK
jgi:hypothetical protein